MNWYDRHLVSYAKLSEDAKKTDLKRWGRMHKIICDRLGLNPSDDLDTFMEISDVFRRLTDRLERFPRFDEFLSVWILRHPEWKDKMPAAA